MESVHNPDLAQQKPLPPSLQKSSSGPPALIDAIADRDIPQRVYSAWKPSEGLRPVRRPLTVAERTRCEARKVELECALMPLANGRRAEARASIVGMFISFPAMREKGDAFHAVADMAVHAVSEYPAWAVARACDRIVKGEADLDHYWPPSAAQIRDVVKRIISPFVARLEDVRALLDAPVERQEPDDHDKRPAPSPPFLSPRDRGHAARVAADIESRKAMRSQAWEGA